MFILSETTDFYGLTELFHKNGLEFTIGEDPPIGLIKCWELNESKSGKRVGGMILKKREAEFVLGGMAVEEEYRKQKLGSQMLKKAIEEVKTLGGRRIMLVAKVPDFYKTHDFKSIDRETAPNISSCMTCKQFNSVCFPEVMYCDID